VDPASLPPDARDTIYIDTLPNDVTKRELAHIFRPFDGFRVGCPALAWPGLAWPGLAC
jgi:hypothetical protein